MRGDATFASCGDHGVVECHRVHVKGIYSLPSSAAAPAANLLLLGDWLLATTTLAVSSDASSSSSGGAHLLRGALVRWRVGSFGAPSAVLDLGGGKGGGDCGGNNNRRTGGGGGGGRSGGVKGHEDDDEHEDFSRPTALCHPPAYVDKVLVAFAGGGLQLWNVAAGAKLHTFRNHNQHRRKAETGVDGGARVTPIPIPITALEASPALDVVALGRADGSVTLLDARADAALADFEQAAGPRGASSGVVMKVRATRRFSKKSSIECGRMENHRSSGAARSGSSSLVIRKRRHAVNGAQYSLSTAKCSAYW